MFKIQTDSPQQTRDFAEIVAKSMEHNLVICLEGDLGAGKTLFTQGLCAALNVKETVTSPTFNLMNVYEGTKRVYHFDLYRLENEDDLYEIGFYEYSDVDGEDEVVLIEWPDRFMDCMPQDYLYIKIERGDILDESNTKRRISVDIQGNKYAKTYEKIYEDVKKSCRF